MVEFINDVDDVYHEHSWSVVIHPSARIQPPADPPDSQYNAASAKRCWTRS
jgi:hypothetical protein